MKKNQKIIRLTWTSPSQDKTWVDDGWISNKSEKELSRFIQFHYDWNVTCNCQSEPIQMVLSKSKIRTSDGKRTYFIQNKSGQGHLHHPNCLHYVKEAPYPLKALDDGQYEATFTGFKCAKTTGTSSEPEQGIRPKKQSERVNQLQQFASELLLRATSLMTYSSLNQKEVTPPSWKRLYSVVPNLLSKTYYQNTSLKMGDFYLKTPRAMAYQEQKDLLQNLYGPQAEDYHFITQGRVLDIITPSSKEQSDMKILKIQTKSNFEPDACSYLWISKSQLKQTLSLSPFTFEEIQKTGVWWLIGTIPQTLPTKKATLHLKGKDLTFPIPELQSCCLLPLALNGTVVANPAELICFNQVFEQQLFMKKTLMHDTYAPFKSGTTSTFVWIQPSSTPNRKYDYIMGHISCFTGKSTKFQAFQTEEKERLSTLKNEKMELWHWDYQKTKTCPPFPNFKK